MINNVRVAGCRRKQLNAKPAISYFTRKQELRKFLSSEDMCDNVRLRLLYRILYGKIELQRLHERLRKLQISLHVSPARRGAA